MPSVFEDVGAKITRGLPIGTADLEALWSNPDLVRLGMLGDEARRRRHGDRTTYVRVANVDVAAAPPTVPPAAGEVRITGRPASADHAVEVARAVVGVAKGTPVTAYSLADLHALTGGGRPLEDLVGDLRAAGVAAVAEAPVDALADPRAAVESVLSAGARVARFTCRAAPSTAPTALLSAVRLLQRNTGAVRVFAPLPGEVDPAAPTTGFDDVRLVAVARLFLDDVVSIQVDWSLYGPKLAQVALLFGADDLDNVSAVDDESEGRRRAPLEEVLRNIRAASLVPVQRDGRFSVRES
jgi:aminodeoxyfutalosine synthase